MSILNDFDKLDAVGLAAAIRDGSVHPRDAVDAAIARIEAGNGAVNAVINDRFEAARAEASGDLPDGPFRGVPILVKDLNGQMAGEPNYFGTRFLKKIDARAAEDSYVVARLRRAGFVILGRTNTPEFGSSAVTEPLSYGPTRNPWNLDHTPGGSSGGSAAAVAAGFVPVAHASDGGGSIRIPASCCGLFGLKPSRGRISRGPQAGEGWGGASTDGCVSRTVRDTAAMLDVLAGPEPGDPYVAPPPQEPFALAVAQPPGPLRIGVMDRAPGSEGHPDCIAAVGAVVELLRGLGHQVEFAHPAALEESEMGGHYGTLISVAATQMVEHWSRELGRELGPDDVEASNLAFAFMGREVTGARYLEDLNWLHAWSRRVARYWTPVEGGGDGFDLLVTPTLSRPPVRVGELSPDPADPLPVMAEVGRWVSFTPQFNVTGQPAMNVPVHWNADGLPVGVQIVGAAFGEPLLLALASQLEAATSWPQRRAPAPGVT